jgi:hypothetical protein
MHRAVILVYDELAKVIDVSGTLVGAWRTGNAK